MTWSLRRVVAPVIFALLLLAGLGVRARVGRGWTYAAVDSRNYMGAAVELYEHHQYAVRLPGWADPGGRPQLTYGRPPGYPLFLALTGRGRLRLFDPDMAPVKGTQAVLDLITCALVFLMGWRLGRGWVAWPAFTLAIFHPFLVLYADSIMAETLATVLTTGVLALCLAALGARRAAGWLAGAGALAGAGMLVRPDGVLVLPCLLVPALCRRDPVGVRARGVGLALLCAAAVFAPWPVRNLARFGSPHVLSSVADTRGQAVPRDAFMRWFATWLRSEDEIPDTLWCLLNPQCPASVGTYPARAFDSPGERAEVARLFALRQREGFSAAVDAGFSALAWARTRAHPLRTLVVLPLQRAAGLWVNDNDLPLRYRRTQPWPAVVVPLRRHFKEISAAGCALALAGLALLALHPRWRGQRGAAWLFGVALGVRTAGLAGAGLVEGRYLLEVLPAALVLAGVVFAAIGMAVRGLLR